MEFDNGRDITYYWSSKLPVGTGYDCPLPNWAGREFHVVVRSDLSATLFLTDPADYDGGELVIETAFGAQEVKLAAGDLVLYPSSSLHRVLPVTRGARTAAILWLQSMVRDAAQRALLFDLDQSIQSLTRQRDPADPDLLRLSGVYHNLLRGWAET